MNTISGYGAYTSNLYNSTLQNRKDNSRTEETKKTDTTEKKDVKLSTGAKKLLKELQQKYKNMDFMVADYETEEEAASYLARGTKEYSVLIDPEELEKMAEDEETKKKNLNHLDDAVGKLAEMKEQLTDEDEVTHLGVSIGKDGVLSFFADLEKISEQKKERIEKRKEQKTEEEKTKADKKSEKAAAEKRKRTRVSADSIEELLKKIRDVDWEKVKEETKVNESRIDYMV